MTAVHRLLGPVCLSEPNVCLYVGGKLTTEESQFEEDTLFNLVFRWANSPTPANWGSITDAYWICMAWIKVFDKQNTISEVAVYDAPSVVFTKQVELFIKRFDCLHIEDADTESFDSLLANICLLKKSYKAI